MTGDGGASLASRVQAWFGRLSRVKKVFATSTALVITVGGVASAATSVLDLGERLGVGGPQAERVATVRTSVQKKVRVSEGVLVTEVIPGSPADRAGIEVQDAITDVNGKEVEDVDDFTKILERTRPGETLLLSTVSDGERVTLPVKPEPIEDTSVSVGTRIEDIEPQDNLISFDGCPLCPPGLETTTPDQETPGDAPSGDAPQLHSQESAPAVDQYTP